MLLELPPRGRVNRGGIHPLARPLAEAPYNAHKCHVKSIFIVYHLNSIDTGAQVGKNSQAAGGRAGPAVAKLPGTRTQKPK